MEGPWASHPEVEPLGAGALQLKGECLVQSSVNPGRVGWMAGLGAEVQGLATAAGTGKTAWPLMEWDGEEAFPKDSLSSTDNVKTNNYLLLW